MIRRTIRTRRAFSLAEVVVSLGVLSVVLAGLASSLTLAMRVAPSSSEPSIVVSQLTRALQSIADETTTAISIDFTSTSSISLLVPDRTGDGNPETINYAAEESTRGYDIIRRYNNGAAETVASGITALEIDPPRHDTAPLGIITFTVKTGSQRIPTLRVVAHWLNNPD